MVLIIKDKTLRKVILSKHEIDMLIEELERVPHNCFEFFKYAKTIDKLKSAKKVKKK